MNIKKEEKKPGLLLELHKSKVYMALSNFNCTQNYISVGLKQNQENQSKIICKTVGH